MSDFATLFFQVFDVTAFMYALGSGVTFGAGPLLYLTLKYPSRVRMSTRKASALTSGVTAFMGSLFFAGQIVQSWATDQDWPRAFARAVLWLVFSAGIGFGLAVTRSFAQPREATAEDML